MNKLRENVQTHQESTGPVAPWVAAVLTFRFGVEGLVATEGEEQPLADAVQKTKARGDPQPTPVRYQAKVGVLGLLRGRLGRPGVPPLRLAQRHLAQRHSVLTSSHGPTSLCDGTNRGSRAVSTGTSPSGERKASFSSTISAESL